MEDETKQEEVKAEVQEEAQEEVTAEIQEEAQEEVKAEIQEEVKAEVPQEGQEEVKEKPLDKMTAKELREVALDTPGIFGVHAMKKEELLTAVKEAKGIKDEGPAKKNVQKKVSVGDLKQEIARLKVERAASHESKDRKKRDVLRRRINRLKKRTRKVA